MATLKEHQAAMVDLLANGSAIPASASRLAHAMLDVLTVLNSGAIGDNALKDITVELFGHKDATTPGLNDRALAEDIEAVRPKQMSAELRVKQLENTIRQLKANNARLKSQNQDLRDDIGAMASKLHTAEMKLGVKLPEQAGCRKEDTQVCEHVFKYLLTGRICLLCGHSEPEEAIK